MTKLEILEDIVANGPREVMVETASGQNRKILIDSLSASAMLAVARTLKPENQAKYLAMPWEVMHSFAWQLAELRIS